MSYTRSVRLGQDERMMLPVLQSTEVYPVPVGFSDDEPEGVDIKPNCSIEICDQEFDVPRLDDVEPS